MHFSFASWLFLFAAILLPNLVVAQDLGDMVKQDGFFSYQAPKGWTIKTPPSGGPKFSCDQPENGFAANISVTVENPSGSLEQRVEDTKASFLSSNVLKKVTFIDQKPFETATGLKGIRVVAKDSMSYVDAEQILYFFDGPSAKLVVTGTCWAKDAVRYEPIFDASVKTFSALR